MMDMENIPEMIVLNATLTRLLAPKEFILIFAVKASDLKVKIKRKLSP
jgi:hypothetical protein